MTPQDEPGTEIPFFFRRQPVGVFLAPPPDAPGLHRYMPFRSFGHLRFGQCLARGPVRCCYRIGWRRVWLTVLERPGYGQLVLDRFSRWRGWRFWTW